MTLLEEITTEARRLQAHPLVVEHIVDGDEALDAAAVLRYFCDSFLVLLDMTLRIAQAVDELDGDSP